LEFIGPRANDWRASLSKWTRAPAPSRELSAGDDYAICHDRWILRAASLIRLGPILVLAFHHHFHGPPIDYAGLAAAAAASWAGLPGPGEPLLIAAGLFAAKHKLDIGEVLLIAWAGATAGGVIGWLLGMKAGRVVLTTRGPLHRLRLKALARGDEIFTRHPVVAIFLTPSWIAGIHRVKPSIYLAVNAGSAVLWAVGIGLGAFYIGPDIVEVADDLGLVTGGGVALLIVIGGIWLEFTRRRRKDRRDRQAAESQS
jgi:membrane protein DedA with SNARE-associated domain